MIIQVIGLILLLASLVMAIDVLIGPLALSRYYSQRRPPKRRCSELVPRRVALAAGRFALALRRILFDTL
jgi:hypothetical protein